MSSGPPALPPLWSTNAQTANLFPQAAPEGQFLLQITDWYKDLTRFASSETGLKVPVHCFNASSVN